MANAKKRLKDDLRDALHRMRMELDRVEILAAALGAFAKPVPRYKAEFHHLNADGSRLDRFKLGPGRPRH
jgi:hypothetical protein